jgi:hypothetical protein|tara:strand:- start:643 stop:957 length:315 start_codon:yes stop_codon:yes gene_type:complete
MVKKRGAPPRFDHAAKKAGPQLTDRILANRRANLARGGDDPCFFDIIWQDKDREHSLEGGVICLAPTLPDCIDNVGLHMVGICPHLKDRGVCRDEYLANPRSAS